MSFTVTVIIPAFNEAATIGPIIRRVRQISAEYQILVVDDGSQDHTAEEARQAGAAVISHPYNIGNGAAVMSGVRAALGEIIVLMDGDGQHQPEDIPRLLEQMDRFDMVVGARPKPVQLSPVRGVGNRALIQVAKWLAGRKIPDLTSGFRAFKRALFMDYIHLMPLKYSYPTTITLAAMLGGHFVDYVFLDSIRPRQGGQSDLKPLRDGLRFVHIILRMIMIFAPMRIFLPIGLILFGGGLAMGIFQYLRAGAFFSTTVMLCLGGLFVTLFGLLADQVAALRRLRK